jgi:hypothetical protein
MGESLLYCDQQSETYVYTPQRAVALPEALQITLPIRIRILTLTPKLLLHTPLDALPPSLPPARTHALFKKVVSSCCTVNGEIAR